jgi:transmembrane E3 ubiquitin-protein ligase
VYESDVCKTHLNILLSTLDTETLFGKAINYTLLVTFVAFMQVVVLIRQMEMTSTQAGASRVSLMTVGLQAVADSYLCLGHLTMGIAVPTLFNAFATAAFFKFIIFSIFEMRWLLLIWKARRPSGFAEGWEAMRRELSLLYSRFYGSLLLGIVILYQLQNHLKYFVFALYSFWVPQIVLNVAGDHRKPLHPMYIAGMSVTRLMIPLYFYACPRNFLHIQPQYATALGLVAWLFFQAGVLLSQHRYGSRWFVPKPLLPLKYDYFRAVNTGPDLESGCGAGGGNEDDETAALAEGGRSVFPSEVECCICMTPVEVVSRDRMVTPCDHFFHQECLEQWLNVKLECAVCRQTVPPC